MKEAGIPAIKDNASPIHKESGRKRLQVQEEKDLLIRNLGGKSRSSGGGSHED
jgi:hypothetical protein